MFFLILICLGQKNNNNVSLGVQAVNTEESVYILCQMLFLWFYKTQNGPRDGFPPLPARCRDSRSLTRWEPSGAFWVSHWSHWGRAKLTPPQKEGLAASVRTQRTHFCENTTSKYKKKNKNPEWNVCVPNLTHVIRKSFQKLAFNFVCFYGRENGDTRIMQGEPRLLSHSWLLADGGSENKTIASEETKETPNNDDWRTDN